VDRMLTELRIDESRFRTDFEELSEIGSTGDGGVNRPALGGAHLAARAWFRERIRAAGLEFRTDSAGNHSAYLGCGPAGAPTLMLGSHLDSVPHGGRFDGALGVVAALEGLRVVSKAGVKLGFNLEALDFTDEEGTLVGLTGSAAMAGVLQRGALVDPRGGRQAFEAALAQGGLTEEGLFRARRDPATLAGYMELHIEQGRQLVDAGIDIGIVAGIAGINSYRVRYLGRADHAGTTPMDARRDAALGASAFALDARKIVMSSFAGCVANVGDMRFSPGAFNIVPAEVSVALEFRAPDAVAFTQMEDVLLEMARSIAERYDLGLEIEWLGRCDPAAMHPSMQRCFSQAAEGLGLTHATFASGAGHDAQSFADLCPIGMIFVPSVDGASHSAREFTRWDDCVNGANVLLQAALRFAQPSGGAPGIQR